LLAVVGWSSWQLLNAGPLPIVPHWLTPGPSEFRIKVTSVIWWLAVAASISAAASLAVAVVVKIRGAAGHRAVKFISDGFAIAVFAVAGIALSAFVFEFPVSTVLATSSIVAVVLGFALQKP
jgi:small-conductance mechanosensitive channel